MSGNRRRRCMTALPCYHVVPGRSAAAPDHDCATSRYPGQRSPSSRIAHWALSAVSMARDQRRGTGWPKGDITVLVCRAILGSADLIQWSIPVRWCEDEQHQHVSCDCRRYMPHQTSRATIDPRYPRVCSENSSVGEAVPGQVEHHDGLPMAAGRSRGAVVPAHDQQAGCCLLPAIRHNLRGLYPCRLRASCAGLAVSQGARSSYHRAAGRKR